MCAEILIERVSFPMRYNWRDMAQLHVAGRIDKDKLSRFPHPNNLRLDV